MGAKAENCCQAISALSAVKGCLLHGQSLFYKTEPVGLEDQDWFVNGAIRIRTALDPQALLAVLRSIEIGLGRSPGGARFGPRVLDLDILFFDNLVLRGPQLEIPHPRLHERRFVLKPLCDLAPEFVHPVLGKTVRFLLSHLDDDKKVIALAL